LKKFRTKELLVLVISKTFKNRWFSSKNWWFSCRFFNFFIFFESCGYIPKPVCWIFWELGGVSGYIPGLITSGYLHSKNHPTLVHSLSSPFFLVTGEKVWLLMLKVQRLCLSGSANIILKKCSEEDGNSTKLSCVVFCGNWKMRRCGDEKSALWFCHDSFDGYWCLEVDLMHEVFLKILQSGVH
jgi:hypothetical protein